MQILKADYPLLRMVAEALDLDREPYYYLQRFLNSCRLVEEQL